MTDKQLAIVKEALMEADLREMAIIDALPDEEITFSEKYKNAISKLMNNTRRSTRSFSKKATVILVAILTSLILVMSVSAIREPIVNFLVEFYDNYINVTVDNKDNQESVIEAPLYPSYMIEGYTLKSVDNLKSLSTTIWANESDDVIELTQQINRDNFNIHMNNPEGGYKSIVLQSDLNLYYYSRDGYYSFFWVDDTYFYYFLCPDTIELSEIEKIIDSMEPTKS
ncbi:MAG: DUF4367 domain-containing protein [Clostridia bacterium]|nr:DUF4367 domain-containing protein [Clostridia bacterium]